jgi:hypothetical protein
MHTSPSRVRRRSLAYVVTAVLTTLLPLAAPESTSGQDLTLGAIEGTIVDQTGAFLPGATVVLTSPALQVRQLETQSDAEGRYRFSDLRLGVYAVQATLQGFQTVVREDVQLSAGFVARIDLPMSIGTVNETLTVSAASPVIDLASTRGGRTLDTRVLLESVPVTGHAVDLVKLTPGMEGLVATRSGNPATQGQNASGWGSAYGQGGATILLDGFEQVPATPNTSILDSAEMDVKTYGNTAEIASPGFASNFVYPSGGNEFHGGLSGGWMHKSLQGSNLDASKAGDPRYRALFSAPEEVRYHSDLHGNLGGRILVNKLWFFTSMRYRTSERSVTGFVLNAGPDGRYLTGDEPPAFPSARQTSNVGKVSYQVTPQYQLVGMLWRDWSVEEPQVSGSGLLGGGSYSTVPYESSSPYLNNGELWNGQFRGAPSSNLAFELRGGKSGFHVQYNVPPEYADQPSKFERTTQLYTGPSLSTGFNTAGGGQAERRGHPYFYLYSGNVTYVPRGGFGGDHTLKAGYETKLSTSHTRAPNHRGGNYLLVYDGGRPVEILTLSLPLDSRSRFDAHSAFITDQWRVGRSLTFNLGLRFQRMIAFVPPQSREASTFAVADSYPRVDVGTWNEFQPRAAVAWDPTGSARTVVKATYGRFVDSAGGGLPGNFSDPYNPAVTTVTTYRWTDPNGNGNYDAGEVDLSTTPGNPAFINISGTSNLRPLSGDFKMPATHEITASIERELIPNMSGRVLYVYKLRNNDFTTINVARPYSAFNIPLQRRDPGPDGITGNADDGPMVTIWDYDPAFRGSQFVSDERVNRPSDRNDSAQTFEVAVTKRRSAGWNMGLSYNATKQHRWLTGIPTSPNDDYYPLDETWTHAVRANGAYRLPFGIDAGGSLVLLSGVAGQRTYIFRAQDPLGGTPLRQQTTVNLRLEPFGASRGPMQPYMDLRVSKRFRVQTLDMMVSADVLNGLNTDVARTITFASGPTFGHITQVPPPRALRIGAQLFF